MKGVTVSSGFRDLTIPCENFSLPPTTFQPPPPSYPLLCDVSALALLSPKTSRFVGLTTYRCRVRFRGPGSYILASNIVKFNMPVYLGLYFSFLVLCFNP